MNVESRMAEFEKVSDKQNPQDVSERMKEFEQVDKEIKCPVKNKEAALPYGIKRIRICDTCGEFMEIQEIKEKQAIYYCPNCDKTVTISNIN